MSSHRRTWLYSTLVVLLAIGALGWLTRTQVPSTSVADQGQSGRKILYYRHPMGLADVSSVPKKDAMGMDYVPVYDVPMNDAGITLDAERVQKTGVQLEAVSRRVLQRPAQWPGRVEADERRQYVVAPRFEGWIEKIQASTTGKYVRRGEPLFEVFSPDLVSAQKEYLIAAQYITQKSEDLEQGLYSLMPQTDVAMQGMLKQYEGGKVGFSSVVEAQWQIRRSLDEFYRRIRLPKGNQSVVDNAIESHTNMQRIADATLARLHNLEVPEARIKALQLKKEPPRLMPYLSPVSGIVTEKKAVQGMRFAAGDVLYQITDISSVWVLADVYEQDVASLRTGQEAHVRIDAYPGKVLHGRIEYIYPTFNAQTRTVPVRVELANPEGLLRPGMFARVDVAVSAGEGESARVLAVPLSAVLDSGRRQRVFVQTSPGHFEAREVQLGQRGATHVQVLSGLQEGDQVVTAGNFLIDSESNLHSALKGLSGPAWPASATAAVSHQATGVIDSMDASSGKTVISHEPVASLNWPRMTMEFVAVRADLLAGLRPGEHIGFEFIERKPGEWVITRIEKKGP